MPWMQSMRRSSIGLLVGTCLAGVVLSACGRSVDTRAGAPSTSTSVTRLSTSAAPPTSTAPQTSTSPQTSTAPPASSVPPVSLPPVTTPGARLTLTGTVQEGAEAHCLVLKDEKTGLQVNLTGATTAIRVGSRVTVAGEIRTDLMSYCQQGRIFVVSSVTVGSVTVGSTSTG